jgi:hypothetical protein
VVPINSSPLTITSILLGYNDTRLERHVIFSPFLDVIIELDCKLQQLQWKEQGKEEVHQRSFQFFLQLCGPATALGRKFLHDLKTARHFESFVICIIRKFQLCSNNSVYAAAFLLLRGRAPAQLRGNFEVHVKDGGTRLNRLAVARDCREGRKIVLEAPVPTADCSA